MKYVVLIGDGMSDLPVKELGGRTPLEAANTPNMDYLAQNGVCGWVLNVPKGMKPGSDVAAMSIFGYNPKNQYAGRGPMEAASLGIKMKKRQVAFRCNFVTIKDGKMDSFTADHITTKEAGKLIESLNKKLERKNVKFHTGLSYRHILMTGNASINAKCTPPHDITGKEIGGYLPKSEGAEFINYLMGESIPLLLDHPVNLARIKNGKKPASMIWLWGQGGVPHLRSFKSKYNRTAGVVTAVHLLKGLGLLLGMDAPDVPGATGFLDTNYKGKVDAALKLLEKRDVVFLHVEAPDECGHMGDVKGKIRAIEDFDSKVVGEILKVTLISGYPDTRILVLPDHPTPIKYMTHTRDYVPFVLFKSQGARTKSQGIKRYNEKEIKKSKLKISQGYKLLKKVLFK